MATEQTGYWILVIDDDSANLTMANTILSSEGMRVSYICP